MVFKSDTGQPRLTVNQLFFNGRAGSIPVFHPKIKTRNNVFPTLQSVGFLNYFTLIGSINGKTFAC